MCEHKASPSFYLFIFCCCLLVLRVQKKLIKRANMLLLLLLLLLAEATFYISPIHLLDFFNSLRCCGCSLHVDDHKRVTGVGRRGEKKIIVKKYLHTQHTKKGFFNCEWYTYPIGFYFKFQKRTYFLKTNKNKHIRIFCGWKKNVNVAIFFAKA